MRNYTVTANPGTSAEATFTITADSPSGALAELENELDYEPLLVAVNIREV